MTGSSSARAMGWAAAGLGVLGPALLVATLRFSATNPWDEEDASSALVLAALVIDLAVVVAALVFGLLVCIRGRAGGAAAIAPAAVGIVLALPMVLVWVAIFLLLAEGCASRELC
jgi:hypothetical protein